MNISHSNTHSDMKLNFFSFRKKAAPAAAVQLPREGNFCLDDVIDNANSEYPTESNKRLAYGAARYAQVIAEHFAGENIDYMARPADMDPDAGPDALPIHFLFKRDGRPVVAVAVVTADGYRTPRVMATRLWCLKKGIKYIRMYATGPYADWITGESTGAFDTEAELQRFCKDWVVRKIQDALK